MTTTLRSPRRARRRNSHGTTVGAFAAVAASLVLAGCAGGAPQDADRTQPSFTGTAQESGTTALLQAVSVVDSQVVWVSGHEGSYARTTDGGASWQAAVVSGADSLQFRDVYAVDARTAYLMSAGAGELSRIYKTTDAGATWTLQFTNHEPGAFFDCMAFWDADHGLAMSDAVDGSFPVITTEDGGQSWKPTPAELLPPALEGEGGFAASGTCVITRAPGHAWIGTGNTSAARVLTTSDRGRSWHAVPAPLRSGEGAGIMSLAFRDDLHGAALGGSIADTASRAENVALTADGGRSWTLVGRAALASAVYGSSYVPAAASPTLVAVGPGGAAASFDEGRSWMTIDTAAYWAVSFASPSAGWAVGPGGRVTRFGDRKSVV